MSNEAIILYRWTCLLGSPVFCLGFHSMEARYQTVLYYPLQFCTEVSFQAALRGLLSVSMVCLQCAAGGSAMPRYRITSTRSNPKCTVKLFGATNN